MRLKGIPPEYTAWYYKRLKGRRTALTFDDFTSDPFLILMGLDQGCPLSPIAFLFYNADLIDITKHSRDKLGLGFIDDTAFAARGKDFEEANKKPREIMESDDGALAWGRQHKAEFELDKTALICASCGRKPDPNNRGKSTPLPRPPIHIQGHRVEPTKSYKFLSVIIDEELKFRDHAAYVIAKGTKYVLACGQMTRASKGVQGNVMKKLYESVAIPKMLYAIDVWGTELLHRGRGKREKGWGPRGFTKQIDKVQRMASLLITGGMRSTATDTLLAHAECLPTTLLIHQHCHRATLRLVTLPKKHPLMNHTITAHHSHICHKSPLHQLFDTFNINPKTMETIQPIQYAPHGTPRSTSPYPMIKPTLSSTTYEQKRKTTFAFTWMDQDSKKG